MRRTDKQGVYGRPLLLQMTNDDCVPDDPGPRPQKKPFTCWSTWRVRVYVCSGPVWTTNVNCLWSESHILNCRCAGIDHCNYSD
jgi:hypothetical protein